MAHYNYNSWSEYMSAKTTNYEALKAAVETQNFEPLKEWCTEEFIQLLQEASINGMIIDLPNDMGYICPGGMVIKGTDGKYYDIDIA